MIFSFFATVFGELLLGLIAVGVLYWDIPLQRVHRGRPHLHPIFACNPKVLGVWHIHLVVLLPVRVCGYSFISGFCHEL